MRLVKYSDPTLYNPVEFSSIHPVQRTVVNAQSPKCPTEREIHHSRARFDVKVAYIKFFKTSKEWQDIIRAS
jgi:hypothetical protein